MTPLLDTATDFGARAERRLRQDRIGWLVTISQDGTPQPNAVWFVWDGARVLIYSMPNQAKLKHIARHPQVALHLDSQADGDDIVVLVGTAAVDATAPPANENPAYLEKYAAEMVRLELGTPDVMAQTYSVAIRITPSKVRGF